jgi:hypothetical protein
MTENRNNNYDEDWDKDILVNPYLDSDDDDWDDEDDEE